MSTITTTDKVPVPIEAYNKTEVAGLYGISIDTLNAWTADIQEFGEYRGRRFTLRQVELIFEHCGRP
jgi:hypothetical protein